MFSRVRNVMEALLTQNNDGDIVKLVNECLLLLKILPSTPTWLLNIET